MEITSLSLFLNLRPQWKKNWAAVCAGHQLMTGIHSGHECSGKPQERVSLWHREEEETATLTRAEEDSSQQQQWRNPMSTAVNISSQGTQGHIMGFASQTYFLQATFLEIEDG